MKKFLLKSISAVLLTCIVLSALMPVNAYTDHFDVEDKYNVRISADEVFDESGKSIARQGGNDRYETVIEDSVKGGIITLYGFFACDVKISRFGYKYGMDGEAVMNSEKFISSDYDILVSINESVIGKTGEVSRFRIDVPAAEGENELFALVELQTGEIYEIWRVLYTGEESEDFGDFKEEYIPVILTVNGTDVVNRQYTVPGYIYYDYFELEMLSVTTKIQESTGQESAAISVKINGEEVDFGSYYEMPPEHIIAVLQKYNKGDVISLTYEEKAIVTLDSNYEEGLTDKVYAVHGSYAALSEQDKFIQKGKFIKDWNTEPDGSGTSCYLKGYGYAAMPEDPSVDLNSLTLYAIWADFGEPGDISGDGEANNKDVVVLFKYLSGANVEYDELALDVNNDGLYDNKDVVTLFRFVSGGDDSAYYNGYTAKRKYGEFSFELPKGFSETGNEATGLTMYGNYGDMITAAVVKIPGADLSEIPDEVFTSAVAETGGADVIGLSRTVINGHDAVAVQFIMYNQKTIIAKTVFVAGVDSLLNITCYDVSGCYIFELEDVINSIK